MIPVTEMCVAVPDICVQVSKLAIVHHLLYFHPRADGLFTPTGSVNEKGASPRQAKPSSCVFYFL